MQGETGSVADRLSCYPNKKNTCTDLEERFTPHVASKSLRMKSAGSQPIDPHVKKIAKLGKKDANYEYMVDCIKQKTQINAIKADIELKKL